MSYQVALQQWQSLRLCCFYAPRWRGPGWVLRAARLRATPFYPCIYPQGACHTITQRDVQIISALSFVLHHLHLDLFCNTCHRDFLVQYIRWISSILTTTKPDTSSPTCTSPICDRSFSFYTRRHHCRRCGNIFCSRHSSQTIPLDSNANFDDEDGTPVRSCERCFDEFCAWEMAKEERSRSNSESSDDLVPQSPAVAVGATKGGKNALKGVMGQEMGQSVPRDWSWSTF